ncbi:MAG TPA: hypothetical protein VN885_04010 [Candidatus Acidoferrales bacterium]|nr:hypothetical protein [Candidatus Acidoferrales bacterium]
MKTKAILALLAIWVISSCVPAFGQKLYPVKSPLASHPTPPVFSGQISGPLFGGPPPTLLNSWTVAKAEVLAGKCTVVKPSSLNEKTPGAPDSYPPQPDLAFAWDAIFGPGYFAAHILGQTICQGIFTGDKGTVLQVELLDEQRGAAVDNKGNVYKVAW